MRFPETSSMDFFTWLIDAVPCSTAEAWLCACSATCSTEEVSSSTEALVSSRVEAWLCAPSASFWALAEISSLEEAIWLAFSCTIANHVFQLHRHAIQRLGQDPRLILLHDVKFLGEVAVGDKLGKVNSLGQRFCDGTRNKDL